MRCCFLLFFLIATTVAAQQDERRFSLYFEHNSHTLTEAHLTRLDSLKRLTNKDELDIHIRGYANNIGTESYNLRLSSLRAQNVKAQLREFTIISSTGYGELETDSANDRRVDILVHRKVDHVPVEGEIIEPPMDQEDEGPNITNWTDFKKGDKIVLKDIFFYADQDVIMNESKDALDELTSFLKQNPTIRFRLIGHICCGDPESPGRDLINERTGARNLSEARAQSLRNYLVKKGIDKKRIRYVGMAFRNPTGKGDRFDRRVEIEIISID